MCLSQGHSDALPHRESELKFRNLSIISPVPLPTEPRRHHKYEAICDKNFKQYVWSISDLTPLKPSSGNRNVAEAVELSRNWKIYS